MARSVSSSSPADASWRTLSAVLATALAVLVVYVAYTSLDRESTGPASGNVVSGREPTTGPAAPGTLRVATFNIRRGLGTDGFRDVARIARQLDRLPMGTPDIVGLNEVDGAEEGFSHQAAAIGIPLRRNWIFAPAERRFGTVSMANALLTNLPVEHWQRVPLVRTTDKGCRNYLLTTLNIDGRPVHVIVTHLDRSTDREGQLRTVIDLFRSLQPPVILMGDLNTERTDPQLKQLLESPGVVEGIATLKKLERPDRIDWIFARGLEPIDAGYEDLGLSDHPVVWAAFRLAR
jgi:endonuclease/exonuclease/phosphatase family metal-dependent hydrolase